MDKMAETELRNELKKYADFDILNEEKITPFFVKMAKGAKAESDLNVIKNIDGTEFQSDKDRENFIYEYYRNLYKKPDCIEKFLGADICNSSNVRNSKLTERESNMLNNDFTIAELDKAMGDLNTGTASGPDGLGNTVLKKLWKFIRMPFLKYANHCLYTGVLTENFRTASIKLIPKKGDTSQIKNWRPISLLNCSYKIISKAINERLKKISNRVLSRGQKGFTAGKYIQECTINIVETIEKCEANGIKAILFALDQEKAFDSVRHDFMRLVFKFFNFPEKFIKMLEVLRLTERQE
jgi:Reverse transcriptase (RNA-dependent DNA polymerase)